MNLSSSALLLISLVAFLFTSIALANIVSGTSTTNISAHVTFTQLTINKPVALVGDVMVASIAVNDGSVVNVTAPSGWTQILRTDNDVNVALISYWKAVGPSEPGTYTWTIDEQTKAVGGITPYSGVSISNPIDAVAGNTGFSTTATTSTITLSGTNEEVIALFATDVNKSLGTPMGLTQKYNLAHTGGPSTAAYDVLQATAGTAGSKSSTISGNKARNWVAQQIALNMAQPTANNIVSYWKLDESSGDASDSVGGNTLTNSGSLSYGAGIINNGIVLSGTNVLDGSLISSTTTNWTMTAWIKISSTNQNGVFFHNGSTTSNGGNGDGVGLCVGNGSSCSTSGNELTVQYYNVAFEDTGGAIGAAGWHFITVTRDTTTTRYYIDGVQTANTTTDTPTAPTSVAKIGGDQGNFFAGTVDEVGFWNRQLSGSEITQLYNSGAGLQYPF